MLSVGFVRLFLSDRFHSWNSGKAETDGTFTALIYRSGFLPRFLGVLLIAAGFGYVADSVTPLLLPGYAHMVDRFASVPLMLGEPALILWLLIVGAKDQPLRAAA